jgi:hypothetical protein
MTALTFGCSQRLRCVFCVNRLLVCVKNLSSLHRATVPTGLAPAVGYAFG